MRRHELDVVSLVFGLFFVGVAAIWGLTSDPGHAIRGWPLPVLLIAVGLVGLLSSLVGRRGRAGSGTEQPQPADPTPARPTGPSDRGHTDRGPTDTVPTDTGPTSTG